jgi:uncharacterized membrane protein YdbT with pleckstrin-like domain
MSNLSLINERSHPIETTWVIKNVILWSPFCAFALAHITEKFIFSYFIIGLIISPPLIYLYLKLAIENYHYEFGEKLITLKQGIISKSERTVMYGRIQNVCVSQGIINRLLGLASISIETASEGAGAKFVTKDSQYKTSLAGALLGFRSNRIGLPGLTHENALELKDILMKRIKDNPIDDAQSGL